jgi:hypothetical protein
MTYVQARKLASEYLLKLLDCHSGWKETEAAGVDCIQSFMKRHLNINL